jgi:catechol 2,3-dioxygenase-like lactoylglutathione lyase family enzyme
MRTTGKRIRTLRTLLLGLCLGWYTAAALAQSALPGKGDARWHRATQQLFLGIDHTAIVVANTAASPRFYRDMLGLQVVGESDNYGPEQERLNSVFGARLHITTLRAASGPGIECLEYLTPRDGRPTPADVRANDLVHWQTTLVTHDVGAAAHQARAGLFHRVSPGEVALPDTHLGFSKGLLVRDTDHAMTGRSPPHEGRPPGKATPKGGQ